MKYSLLLCDADNTIFDFNESARTAYRIMCGEMGLPFSEETFALYQHVNDEVWKDLEAGRTTAELLKRERFVRLNAQAGFQRDPGQMSEAYMRGLKREAPLMPGAMEALAKISACMPVALVTNGFKDSQTHRFLPSPIMRYVQRIYISEDYGHPKPHPAMLLQALEDFGVPANRALMAGDSVRSDIQAAINASMDSCLVGGAPNAAATYYAADLSAMTKFVLV